MHLFAVSEMARCTAAKFFGLYVTHGLGLKSIGVIITIYFRPIQHHISTNDLLLTENKQITKLAECHIPYTV